MQWTSAKKNSISTKAIFLWIVLKPENPIFLLSIRAADHKIDIRDFTNQNATQFGNTETEKGLGRERRHERGKNKVTDANATSLEAELYKSFKLCFIAGVSLYIIKWQHSERQGKL